MSIEANTLIGEYRITASLGAGGMGEVYHAVHTHLGRVIAIKVLSPELTDGESLRRFSNEADIQARLRHPSVADFFGYYEFNGRPCILMEYIDGKTLSEIIESQGALPVVDAVRIMRDLSAAIANFHSQGVVHRDIKTGNIKIARTGEVKILDFGIARHQKAERLTRTGAVVGTTQCLAPEQVAGKPVGFPVDIWQLGILFYEILTGSAPFESHNVHDTYQRILSAQYVPVQKLRPNVPNDLVKIIDRCLQKDPSKRYADGAALCNALNQPKQTSVPGKQLVAPQIFRRFRMWGLSAAAAAVIIAMVISISMLRKRSELSGPENETTHTFDLTTLNGVTSDAANVRTIHIATMDGKAQVFLAEKFIGNTPLDIKARVGEMVNLTLKRKGFEDKHVAFDVTKDTTYSYLLQSGKAQ